MKIIRTICQFKKDSKDLELDRISQIEMKLQQIGFTIQTKRVCHAGNFGECENLSADIMVSVGTKKLEYVKTNINDFFKTRDNFNIELSSENIDITHVEILFEIIKNAPHKTFNFTYVFNNTPSSPYMPSAQYARDGFAIGLQPTDLAKEARNLNEWLDILKNTYNEINDVLSNDNDYLGIDTSIAPLFEGDSSLINIVNRFCKGGFEASVTTNFYTRITNFIKNQNVKTIGLCGIMLPCLEDFELAKEYEKGNFNIERNIYLSLHSGLGIDTYPIGVDESPDRVLDILKLIQALSNKYKKSLSVRFVSDGVAKISEKSNFKNQYLYDVVIKGL
ncbi:DUF711 family protein [Candidatus Dojkabacteria bacterium]|nr:DUF711 family protein [Candidatus Dojkabacteria bacterium]